MNTDEIKKENIPLPTGKTWTKKSFRDDLRKILKGMSEGDCYTIASEKAVTFYGLRSDEFPNHEFVTMKINDKGEQDNKGTRFRFWLKEIKSEFELPDKGI